MNNYLKGLMYQTLIRRAYKSRKVKAADNTLLENLLDSEVYCPAYLPPVAVQFETVKGHIVNALQQFQKFEGLPGEAEIVLETLLKQIPFTQRGDQLYSIVEKALEATRYYKDY